MGKIVGAGSLIVDVTAYANRLPVDGETSLGSSLKFGPGGKGNNQMTAVQRAGGEAIIISRRADDLLGGIMKKHYIDEKMCQKYITVDDTAGTGAALIEVNQTTAENRIIVIKAACDKITAADVEAAWEDFEDCDVVLTQLETSIPSVLKCKEMAKKYNKPFVLNPAPFQELPEGLFEDIDYLTPNETEAEFFTGIPVVDEESAKKAANALHTMGVRNVIITLGAKGAYYSGESGELLVPGITVDAVDTTGAGDAFNGGFAYAISERAPIEKALQFANCVGALSVTKFGTAPAMPYHDDILEFMRKIYHTTI